MTRATNQLSDKYKELSEWLVLSDGKKLQIYHRRLPQNTLQPRYQHPLAAWEIKEREKIPASLGGIDQISAVLTRNEEQFDRMTLIAPLQVATAIKCRIPDRVHSKLVRSIYRDLTYCHKAALADFFEGVRE